MGRDWSTAELNPDFLIDSGLLFEVNRQFFHPLGLALVISTVDEKRTISLKDFRADPSSVVFDKQTVEAGFRKWTAFLSDWGYSQMDKRSKRLGWTVQHAGYQSPRS